MGNWKDSGQNHQEIINKEIKARVLQQPHRDVTKQTMHNTGSTTRRFLGPYGLLDPEDQFAGYRETVIQGSGTHKFKGLEGIEEPLKKRQLGADQVMRIQANANASNWDNAGKEQEEIGKEGNELPIFNGQESYTELLYTQIRNSQEKMAAMEAPIGTENQKEMPTSFMDLLTSKYVDESLFLQGAHGQIGQENNGFDEDFEVTIRSIGSDEEDQYPTWEFREAYTNDEAESEHHQGNDGQDRIGTEACTSMYHQVEAQHSTCYSSEAGPSNYMFRNEKHQKQQSKYSEEDPAAYENMNWREDIFENMQLQEVLGEADDIAQATVPESNGCEAFTEELLEEFIQNEINSAKEGNNADIDSKYTPQIDQEFRSREDAYHFFKFYGLLAGFEIKTTHVTRTQSRKRDREIVKVEMRCHKCGKNAEDTGKKKEKETIIPYIPQIEGVEENVEKEQRDTNVQVKTNCPVMMLVKENQGIWTVVKLDLDHNHELNPENSNQIFSGRKYMTEMEMAMVRTLNANNIPTRKMIAILSYLRGGIMALPYKTKDVANLRTKINREVSGNDMTKVLQYFQEKEAKDPTFYYRFELDEDKKVKNIFWREGVSLQYYAEYGDCVSFDTTYMTNRYRLPFAPFCGITGHGHTCIFACAYMSDETTSTFKWIFKQFLQSMGGKQPKSIITDQDKAMRAAIEEVFREAIHRNCFFHIKYKCYNKNGKVFAANDGLIDTFEDIVNNSITIQEFEDDWQGMIEEKGLQQNKYFTKMWQNRERFIPVYYKDKFFPFLQSTGRSEGTNARIKENVGSTYSILSCLHEFERMIDATRLKESFADKQSREKRPKELLYGYNIERQAMELYNRNIFKKFQFQLQLTERLKYKETEQRKCFEVWAKQNQVYKQQKLRKYIVLTDLSEGQEEFSCICGKFNKDGILCSHILKVIVEEDISAIPEKYYIDRWRKKESKMNLPERKFSSKTHEMLRYNVLSRKAAELSSIGSKSKEAMEYLNEAFDILSKNLELILSSAMAPDTANISANNSNPENEGNEKNHASTSTKQLEVLQDPDRVKPKGRPALPMRMKPRIEELKEQIKKDKKKAEKKKAAEEKNKDGKQKSNQPSPKNKPKKRQKKSNQVGAEEQEQ